MKVAIRRIFIVLSIAALGPFVEAATDEADPYEALSQREFSFELMRHLYRWYLESADFDKAVASETFSYHVVPIHAELDEGDESLFAELYFPVLDVAVRLKKTDYIIEELGREFASDTFKIINVEKVDSTHSIPDTARLVSIPMKELMDYLFETRTQADPPDEQLLARLEKAAHSKLRARLDQISDEGKQNLFISPVSPVANEIWVYWLEGKLLIRWTSDIDIAHESVWEHEHLAVETIDIEERVVLSYPHVPGSNAYFTRHQIGRVLYNCVVIGQRLQVEKAAL